MSRLNCRNRGSSRRSSSKLSSSRAGFLPSSSPPPPPHQQQQRHPRPTSAASSSLQFDHIEMDHVANYGGGKGELDMVDVAAGSRRNTTATVEEDKSLDETHSEEMSNMNDR